MILRLLLLVSCVALTISTLGVAQDSSCDTRTVLVPVLNKNWQTLSNLGTENFLAETKKGKVEVISVVPNTAPRKLVLLLDTSKSLTKQSVANMQQLAIGLASAGSENTEVSAYTFSEQLDQHLGSSEDLRQLLGRLHTLRAPTGRTAIWDSVLQLIAKRNELGPEDMVYILSDATGDTKSRASRRDLERALLKSGLRLSATVLLTSRDWTGVEETYEKTPLEEVAAKTGGVFTVWRSWDPEKLPEASTRKIELLAKAMTHHYKLTVRTEGLTAGTHKWDLRLRNLPAEIKGFRPLYPQSLPACQVQAVN